VPLFPSLAFRRSAPGHEDRYRDDLPDDDLPGDVLLALPLRFEAVGEALARGADVAAACSVVGRDVARDGAALGEALSGLRSTYELVLGTDPSFEAAEALSVAWSEATLEYLHDLSCEDPLTGLASLAHVRSRLDEIYREAELTDVMVSRSHALVVVELCFGTPTTGPGHHFTRALRLVQVTETMRAVYSGGQTLGRLGLDRAVAVVPRGGDLGMSVALLREFLGDLDLGDVDLRVWIEGLPPSAGSATLLLDELAR
jgi:GGDEF domain-containing protein